MRSAFGGYERRVRLEDVTIVDAATGEAQPGASGLDLRVERGGVTVSTAGNGQAAADIHRWPWSSIGDLVTRPGVATPDGRPATALDVIVNGWPVHFVVPATELPAPAIRAIEAMAPADHPVALRAEPGLETWPSIDGADADWGDAGALGATARCSDAQDSAEPPTRVSPTQGPSPTFDEDDEEPVVVDEPESDPGRLVRARRRPWAVALAVVALAVGAVVAAAFGLATPAGRPNHAHGSIPLSGDGGTRFTRHRGPPAGSLPASSSPGPGAAGGGAGPGSGSASPPSSPSSGAFGFRGHPVAGPPPSPPTSSPPSTSPTTPPTDVTTTTTTSSTSTTTSSTTTTTSPTTTTSYP